MNHYSFIKGEGGIVYEGKLYGRYVEQGKRI